MNTKAIMTTVFAAMLATVLEAAVSVANVTARQRYPWNGKVDIDYEIVGDDAAAEYWVYPKGTDNRLGKRVIMNTLSGDGASSSVKVGKHRMVWDAKADMPNFHTTDFTVTMQVVANAAQYLVIDVSGGVNAVNYPVRYSTVGPDLSDDTCRTTEIWLKLILPGTFIMGSPAGTYGRQSNEVQHQVTLTKPFYMAIFETTQTQWQNIMGNNPSSNVGGIRPLEHISYAQIRGSSAGAQWPHSNAVDSDSFMGLMRQKTQLHWDLPTEAQWEYTCRAGTTTDLNTGKNITSYYCDQMSSTGRYYNNTYVNVGGYANRTGAVGYYYPANPWGLHNMHGNVREWCLDWFNDYLSAECTTDPVGWTESASSRVVRGGCYNDEAQYCTSSRRYNMSPTSIDSYTGFRAVILPFE